VQRVQTLITLVGQRSFAFQGLTVWNSLPSALRDSSLSLNMFQRQLQTHLFGSHERHPTPLWSVSAILAQDIDVTTLQWSLQ